MMGARWFGAVVVLACAWMGQAGRMAAQAPVTYRLMGAPNETRCPLVEEWRSVAADVIGTAKPELISQDEWLCRIYDFDAGDFGMHIVLPARDAARLTVAQMDGDGRADLIVAQRGFVSLYYPASSGSARTNVPFTPLGPNDPVPSCYASDLDNDGDLDLVRGSEFCLNTGTGWAAPIAMSLGTTLPSDVSPMDADGDGDIDIVKSYFGTVSGTFGFVSRIARRNASGSLTLLGAQMLFANADTDSIFQTTDANGDGIGDIVLAAWTAANQSEFTIAVKTGGPGPTFSSPASTTFSAGSAQYISPKVRIADLDGDGRRDMIFGSQTADGFANGIFLTTAQGTFVVNRGAGLDEDWSIGDGAIVGTADMNGDGKTDLMQIGASRSVVIQYYDPAASVAVTPNIAESIGPDIVSDGANLRVSVAADASGRPASGRLFTMGGTTVLAKRHANFPGTPATNVTITTSDGHTFTGNVVSASALSVQPGSVTGAGQSATAPAAFPMPLTLGITKPGGQPLVGARVGFAALGKRNIAAAPFAYTDAQGQVAVPVAATGGGAAIAELRVASNLAVTYALSPAGNVVTILAGDNQTANENQAFASAIVGEVRDALGQPIPNIPVTIAWTFGAGRVDFDTLATTTDGNGGFAFSPSALDASGASTYRVTAGGASAEVALNVQRTLYEVPVGGNTQNAAIGDAYAQPFVTRVCRPGGFAVGTWVSFTALTESVTPTATTGIVGPDGTVSTTVIAGPGGGSGLFMVSSVAGATYFSTSNAAYVIDAEVAEQTGFPGGTFSVPLQVNVAGANALGATVTFAAAGPGGPTLSSPTDTVHVLSPGKNGAVVTATAPLAVGTYSVIATTPWGAVVFTLHVVACGLWPYAGNYQAGLPGTVLAQPITTEFFGGTVPIGTPVTFTSLTPGAVTLGPTTALTDAAGRASTQVTVGPVPGSYVVRATTFCGTCDFTVSSSNTLMTMLDGDQQTGTRDRPLALPLRVAHTGAPLGGTTQLFVTSIPAGAVSVTPSIVTVDPNGIAAIDVTPIGGSGPVTVRVFGPTGTVDFHFFERALTLETVSFTDRTIRYVHEHPAAPLIFAVDAPTTPVVQTPWGPLFTSILAPSPTFFALDGIGVTGQVDAGMITDPSGLWTRPILYSSGLNGLDVIAQIYGYDPLAASPLDFIVSNAIRITY